LKGVVAFSEWSQVARGIVVASKVKGPHTHGEGQEIWKRRAEGQKSRGDLYGGRFRGRLGKLKERAHVKKGIAFLKNKKTEEKQVKCLPRSRRKIDRGDGAERQIAKGNHSGQGGIEPGGGRKTRKANENKLGRLNGESVRETTSGKEAHEQANEKCEEN